MGGFIRVDVNRVETTGLNTKVNKEVFDNFKMRCKYQGYQLNIILETFMQQYSNGKFKLNANDILKFKNDGKEVETLNTTFNKEIYTNFKLTCKVNGYFVKHVLTAFMEKYVEENLIMEFVTNNNDNRRW